MSQSKDFDIEDMSQYSDSQIIMLALGDSNPGAYTVVTKLFEIFLKMNLISYFLRLKWLAKRPQNSFTMKIPFPLPYKTEL